MKKKLFILMSCLVLLGLTSCGAVTPEKTVEKYFSALNRLDFTQAATFLGDENIYDNLTALTQNSDSYLENEINNNFAGFIYSNVKCEILSSSKNGSEYEIKAKITSYNIDEVIQTQQDLINEYTASSEYRNLDTGQRYVHLCDQIDVIYKQIPKMIAPAVTETDIYLIQKNGNWTIVPTQELFAALAGGAKKLP